MPTRRIVSFLPASTETVCALGLVDQLVGITHECDYPFEVKTKPVVVRSALETDRMSPREVDEAVGERLRRGQSLYWVDEDLLRELAPDLILTQTLCEVCAPSGNEVSHVLETLPIQPEVLWFTPRSLADIDGSIRTIGGATDSRESAKALIGSGRVRIERVVAAIARKRRRRRVFCMEWLDPVYCSGHWIPEMVELAGGHDVLARRNSDSIRVSWNAVRDSAPEVLILMPCGFDIDRTMAQAAELVTRPGWSEIPAVRSGEVYVVDANAYFARPGPRVVTGVELLAHLFHPDLVPWEGPADAFRQLNMAADVVSAPRPTTDQPRDRA